MSGKGYEDLNVWKAAMKHTKEVYLLTRELPVEERFGLMSQMRRCAVSVSSNIAEGAGRNNAGEFYQFLGIASGSLAELKTQLLITADIYGSLEEKIAFILPKVDEVGRMLSGLKKTVREQQKKEILTSYQ
jgi:four helix bundle protein